MRVLARVIVCIFGFCALPVGAQGLPDWTLAQLEARIAEGDLGKIRALAVEQHGELVYRNRFDGKEPGTPVDVKSAGKSITALAVGAAIADGDLPGTEVAVWPYLGSPRGAPWNTITVADLLSMSSALDCNDWERKSPGREEKMYRKRVWSEFALALPTRDYQRDAQGVGPFSYCTAGVFLLGQVVERATGERFDRYVQRRLFDPLGIDEVEWRKSRSGEIQSGGQLTISDSALLKLARLVLDRGKLGEQQLIPEAWVKDMLSPRHRLSEHVHYANLWWLTPLRAGDRYEAAFMMKGNGGNIVALVPSMDAVLVVQAESYNKREAERNAFIALTTLLRDLPRPPQ
jgi:CubicO group peptidase (beta-lactamase class C family)